MSENKVTVKLRHKFNVLEQKIQFLFENRKMRLTIQGIGL